MMFARKALRSLGIALLLMTMMLAVGALALAEEDPISFTIQISPDRLTAPGEVTVSLGVSNSSDQDMVDPVTLYDPAGNVVPSFGDGGSYILKSGESVSCEHKWSVTQAELDAGTVTYTLKYQMQDESGAMVSFQRQAVGRVQFDGEHAALAVTRSISPEVVRNGKTVTVTYELYNSGNVELTGIKVKENISRNPQTVKSLPAGERTTLTFTAKIGNDDLTSSAEITYKAAGSTETVKQQVEEAKIPLAKPNLKLDLTSDAAGVQIGEAAKLIITFTNDGNVTYSNVSVSETSKGEILTNLTIPAGATVTEEKEFILTEPTTFKVTATLPDNTGETRTMSSKELKLGVFDPNNEIKLTLNLTVEPEAVPEIPSDVRFHLTVTNVGNVAAKDVKIKYGEMDIYTINAMEPGESVTLDRDASLQLAGNYRFTASLVDSLNNTVTFESNTLNIPIARPTAAPTSIPQAEIPAPPVSVSPDPVDPLLAQGEDILKIVFMAMAGLFGCALVLFIVSTVMRIRSRSKSNAAYDHLELAERRDYTEPADEDEEEDLPGDLDGNDYVGTEDIPDARSESIIGAPNDIPAGDGEGGYRISRADQPAPQPQPPQDDEPAQDAAPAQEPAEEGRRRRRRSRKENED